MTTRQSPNASYRAQSLQNWERGHSRQQSSGTAVEWGSTWGRTTRQSKAFMVDSNGRFLNRRTNSRKRGSFVSDAQLNARVLQSSVKDFHVANSPYAATASRRRTATAWEHNTKLKAVGMQSASVPELRASVATDDSRLGLSQARLEEISSQKRPNTTGSQMRSRPRSRMSTPSGRQLQPLQIPVHRGKAYGSPHASSRRSSQSRGSSRPASRARQTTQTSKNADLVKDRIRAELGGGAQGFVEGFRIFRRKAADDGDGKISFPEFQRVLTMINLDIGEEEAELLFNAADHDRSGAIDFQEFSDSFMEKHESSSLDSNMGKAHQLNMQKRSGVLEARERGSQRETEDPITAIREHLLATTEGGQGGVLKAFKMFRQKTGSLDNKISFSEFCVGLEHMNIRLSDEKKQQYFTALDTDSSGSLDFADFAAGILEQTNQSSTGLGADLGEEHSKNQERRRNEQAARAMTQTETDDPTLAIRDHLMASIEGGQGGMLKAFKAFRRKTGSLDNKITFGEFARGVHHMNVKLSASKMKTFFDSLDTDQNGELDFDEFAAGILGRAVDVSTGLGADLGEEHTINQEKRRSEQEERAMTRVDVTDPIAAIRDHLAATTEGGGFGIVKAFQNYRRKTGSQDNKISFGEFVRGMHQMNVRLSASKMKELFDSLDADGSGDLEFAEFAAGILGQEVGDSTGLGQATMGEEHDINTAKRREGQAARAAAQVETADPIEAIRDHLMASIEGGQGGIIRAFKAFRRKTGSLDNKISFKEFARGLNHMNVRLPASKMKRLFDGLDVDGSGELGLAEFAAGILGQSVADSTGLGQATMGEEHDINTAKRREGQAARAAAQVETADPIEAIRQHLVASIEGGQDEMLKAFKAFRSKTGSVNNHITFKEFCKGMHHMNVKLSASKMQKFFKSLDRNGNGSIEFDEFAAGILGQAVGQVRTSLLGKDLDSH